MVNAHDTLLAQYIEQLEAFHVAFRGDCEATIEKARIAVIDTLVEAGPHIHSHHVGAYYVHVAQTPLF